MSEKDLLSDVTGEETKKPGSEDDQNNKDDYEDICYMCRRPESKAGKMIKIPNNICICADCMQKTFDTMNQTGFPMGDMLNMNLSNIPNIQNIPNMPNISMINLSDLQGIMPQNQKLKKKKHLLCRPYVATEIAEAIEKGAPLLDAEIRNALDRITAIEISKEK